MKIDKRLIQSVIAQAIRNHIEIMDGCQGVIEQTDKICIKDRGGSIFVINVSQIVSLTLDRLSE